MRTCPVFQAGPVPDVPHLRSGFRRRAAGSTMADKPVRLCRRSLKGEGASPRAFGLSFLQTPPHDDALLSRHSFMRRRLPFLFASGELLAFGSAKTWHEDFHLASSVPSPAHTPSMRGARFFVRPAQCQCYVSSFDILQISHIFPNTICWRNHRLYSRHNYPTRLLYSLIMLNSGTRRIEKELLQNSLLFLRGTRSLRL